jgi:hypothetical protein
MSFNFEEFVKKYYVHPETIEFFKARLADNVQPYYEVGVEEARKQSVAAAIKYGGTVNLDGKETEFIIPSPHCKGKFFLIEISVFLSYNLTNSHARC